MTTEIKPSRFARFTYDISIRKLEHETDKILALGVVVAISVYTILLVFVSYNAIKYSIPQPPAKTSHIELLVRYPRWTSPFVVYGTKPEKRIIKRGKIHTQKTLSHSLKDRMPFPQKLLPHEMTSVNKRLLIDNIYSYFLQDTSKAGYAPFNELLIASLVPRIPSAGISLKDEMITLDDLDYGRYYGMVFPDPLQKRNCKGFVHIPGHVWGSDLASIPRAVIGLAEGLKKFTKINPTIDGHVMLSSPNLHKFPFIYIGTSIPFQIIPAEQSNFIEYLVNGGFAVLDNGIPQEEYGPVESLLRQMLKDVKQAIGSEAQIKPIPYDHPLFHCFYDFDSAPAGAEFSPPQINKASMFNRVLTPQPYLEGLWIHGRLAAVYSDKGYGLLWGSTDTGNNETQRRFGVNMVVYSLIQSGGKDTKRVDLSH